MRGYKFLLSLYLILITSGLSFADADLHIKSEDLHFKCEVKDELAKPEWPKEFIHIKSYSFAQRQHVEFIDYVHIILNNDGTFQEEPKRIYGFQNRGGYKINACLSEWNEILEEDIDLISSACSVENPNINNLSFKAGLSTKIEGQIKVTIFDTNWDKAESMIPVFACKQIPETKSE